MSLFLLTNCNYLKNVKLLSGGKLKRENFVQEVPFTYRKDITREPKIQKPAPTPEDRRALPAKPSRQQKKKWKMRSKQKQQQQQEEEEEEQQKVLLLYHALKAYKSIA